jgi:hypothetical protein
MDEYRSFDTSTDTDYAAPSAWAELYEQAPARRAPTRQGWRASTTSALPGVAITPEVSENEQHRRTLLSVLSRFAAERSITRTTMHATESFIDALPRGKQLPKVTPDGDGGLLMAWDVPNQARTLATIADWMVYTVVRAGTPQAMYFEDMPFDGVIADQLLAVIPD